VVILSLLGSFYVKLRLIRRGGEVVTRESAKLLCRGSIPLRASIDLTNLLLACNITRYYDFK
jgi:hypothetical protein